MAAIDSKRLVQSLRNISEQVYRIGGPTCDTVAQAADEIERLNKWADGFSDAQLKERRLCEERIAELNEFLRQKDAAMGVLFERLAKAGVDCSDLIS